MNSPDIKTTLTHLALFGGCLGAWGCGQTTENELDPHDDPAEPRNNEPQPVERPLSDDTPLSGPGATASKRIDCRHEPAQDGCSSCDGCLVDGLCVAAPCSEIECPDSDGTCCEPRAKLACAAADVSGVSRDVVWLDSCGATGDLVETCAAPQQACSSGACSCAPGWFGEDCSSCRLFVNATEGDNLNHGGSWEDAFATLDVALSQIAQHQALFPDAACEVWMTAGTYYPTSSQDRLITLTLPSFTQVYGGFRGDEPSLEDRTFEAETIVSGDIDRDGLLDEENSRQIFEAGEQTLLDHLSIEGGYSGSIDWANFPSGSAIAVLQKSFALESCQVRDNFGGAVEAKSANLVIKNSRFTGNHESAAIHLREGHLTVDSSHFEENDSGIWSTGVSTVTASLFRANTHEGLGVSGESVEVSESIFIDHGSSQDDYSSAVYSYADMTVVNGCRFEENQVNPLFVQGNARVESSSFLNNKALVSAGISFGFGDQEVTDCEFRGNHGSEWWAAGGGVSKGRFEEYLMTGQLRIVRSSFHDNSAGYGGAVYVYTGWNRGESDNIPEIVDCIFTENQADYGGAMEIRGTASVLRSSFIANRASQRFGALSTVPHHMYSTVRDSLFIGNSAPNIGAIAYGALIIENSTFALNESTESGGIVEQNGSDTFVPPYCSLIVSNSIFWENSVPANLLGHPDCESFTVQYSNVQGGHPGAGNLNLDPLFVDAPGGDFRLSGNSPLRDAGSNLLMSLDTNDDDRDAIVNEPRPYDLEKKSRLVNPTVDMGAYEFRQE